MMERPSTSAALLASAVGPRPVDTNESSQALDAARGHVAFAEVYAGNFDLVWRSLRHLGVPLQLLDDAVQDVWLVVHRKLAGFDGRSAVSTWLFGICINVARARRRARQVSRPPEPLSQEVESSDPNPEHALASHQLWDLVQGFMQHLPELHRAIFVSSMLLGFSPAETASATGVDVNTVYKRVRALRRSFQRLLERSQESP